MSAIKIPREQRLILPGVSWNKYIRLLRDLEDRHVRLTFDRGVLDPSELGHLGLSLVDGLSDRWGLSLDGKKAVWFEVDVPGKRPSGGGAEP